MEFRILELIVLENEPIREAAHRLGAPVGKLPLALKVALDSLPDFTGWRDGLRA